VNYYQHHIGDYKAATAHLTLIEHGAYRQLLDMYYLDEKPIPLETQVVFRRLCARTQDEQTAVEIVLKEFFEETAKGWRHRRCESELAHYASKAAANRENGKRGGRPKKTQLVSDENPTDSEHEANEKATKNQEPLTKNQEPKKNVTRSASARAQKFDGRAYLVEQGVAPQVADDWLKVRKAKRLPDTATAFTAIKAQADLANLTMDETIRICVVRGWGGFSANWDRDDSPSTAALQAQRSAGPRQGYVSKQEQLERNNRAVAERYIARLQAEEAEKGSDHESE
jgi:uncharacterized protein YdaU (DUF1376 family)